MNFLLNLINILGPYLLVWVVSLLAAERYRSGPDSRTKPRIIRRLTIAQHIFQYIIQHISALPLRAYIRGYTYIYFEENKLSPSSISVSLRYLPHPTIFLIDWFGPPLYFITTSTWAGIDHLASCLFTTTNALSYSISLRLRFS